MDRSNWGTRQIVFALLIVASVGNMLGRIASVHSKRGDTPFLSANDRSRWCSVRSLVDFGTYEIDDVLFRNGKRDPEWYSIDVVKHRGRDGREHFYSSKPTLFPTLLAGEYWCIKKLTGATLDRKPLYVGRVMLVLTNVLPLALYFLLLARVLSQPGLSDWTGIFAMCIGTWGTLISTYAVTINNHTVAAVSCLAACYLALQIWNRERTGLRWFALSGFCAAFMAANELPALSLFAILGFAHLVRSWRNTLIGFLPGALIVIAGVSVTGYFAHGTWLPAYAQRRDGRLIGELPSTQVIELNQSKAPEELATTIGSKSPDSLIVTVVKRDYRWTIFDPQTQQRFTAMAAQGSVELRESGNWYEYEGSYWLDGVKSGVDRGEPSIPTYAFHALIGHHGVFSLTPVWILMVVGVGISIVQRDRWLPVVGMTAITTVVCFAFFIFRPLEDRNYGGVSCGFRWMVWLAPLWIVCTIPALEWIGKRQGLRWLAIGLLLVSVFSASVPGQNPWTHPWIYSYLQFIGYLR